jgi:hypothetical protein
MLAWAGGGPATGRELRLRWTLASWSDICKRYFYLARFGSSLYTSLTKSMVHPMVHVPALVYKKAYLPNPIYICRVGTCVGNCQLRTPTRAGVASTATLCALWGLVASVGRTWNQQFNIC